MIVQFQVEMIGPGFYLVVAILDEGEPIQVGLFSDQEEIDAAVEKFRAEYRRLHLH